MKYGAMHARSLLDCSRLHHQVTAAGVGGERVQVRLVIYVICYMLLSSTIIKFHHQVSAAVGGGERCKSGW